MHQLYTTCDTELEAIRVMHAHARRLKEMGVAWRYGVYAEPISKDRHGYRNHQGRWGVFLVDRKAPK